MKSRFVYACRIGLLFIVMGGALVMTGCEEDEGGNSSPTLPRPSGSTGVLPQDGAYSFSCRLQEQYNISFKVIGGVIRFSMDRHTYYVMPVDNGTFYYVNGRWWGSASDSGNAFPTDGFALSGHFITPGQAVGTISAAGSPRAGTDPAFYDLAPFTATR